MVFGGITAAHAFLADEQILDVDAGHIVAAGRELDRVARFHLGQRIGQRAAGMMVVVAIAGVSAAAGDEACAHRVGVAVHDGGGQQHRSQQMPDARNFHDSL